MSDQGLAIVLFGVLVAATLLVTARLARRKVSADGFYTGDQKLAGWQNGIAISGDHLSAASLLGFTGLTALHGYDSLAYPLTVIVSYVLVLVLVAEPLRNLGRITIADALAVRMSDRSVRGINAICGLIITLAYLISQVVGAASLAKVLLGIDTATGATLAVIVIGVLMLAYVVFGGMNATTRVQIFKASFLMCAVILIVVLTAVHFGFSPGRLLNGLDSSSHGAGLLAPNGLFHSELELVSFSLGNILGTAGLPHVMMRFYTVSTAQKARSSATWTLGIIGLIYVFILVLGFGAASLVGKSAIAKSDPSGNSALPLLAQAVGGGAHTVGGSIMLAVVGALSFATILAVVAGLTISASNNVAHDFYANVIRKGRTMFDRRKSSFSAVTNTCGWSWVPR